MFARAIRHRFAHAKFVTIARLRDGTHIVHGITDRRDFCDKENLSVFHLRRDFFALRVIDAHRFRQATGEFDGCRNEVFSWNVERVKDDNRSALRLCIEA